MTKPDLSNLKRDAEGNILRSELLRINKPVLHQLDECQRRTVVQPPFSPPPSHDVSTPSIMCTGTRKAFGSSKTEMLCNLDVFYPAL